MYDVAFAIWDKLHIINELSIKTAVLFKCVLNFKVWCVNVTDTSIDINFKKMRLITKAITDNDAWNLMFADHFNLSSLKDLFWWKKLQKWILKYHSQKIVTLNQCYQIYIWLKTDNKKNWETLRLDLTRFVQQICIKWSDEAV